MFVFIFCSEPEEETKEISFFRLLAKDQDSYHIVMSLMQDKPVHELMKTYPVESGMQTTSTEMELQVLTSTRDEISHR